MGFAMNAEPAFRVSLVLANLVTNIGMENLGAAARQTTQPDCFKLGEDVLGWPAGEPLEPIPFHGGVRLQMQPRMRLMDDLDNVSIPFIRQLMMQPADDVQLGRALTL